MSKDKFLSIFSHQMVAMRFIALQIFFATCTVLKLEEYHLDIPSFSWGLFSHVMHLDQSQSNKNMRWIIITNSQHLILWDKENWFR